MNFNVAALQLMLDKGLSLSDVVDIASANERERSPDAERQARYRERKDVSEAEWHYIRERVFERDNFACTYCGSKENIACDHVVPLIQGGKSTMENLTTACRTCNCGKSGRTPEEWLAE